MSAWRNVKTLGHAEDSANRPMVTTNAGSNPAALIILVEWDGRFPWAKP